MLLALTCVVHEKILMIVTALGTGLTTSLIPSIVEAYTLKSGSIGIVSKKDVALFPYIHKKPIYFEGAITAIKNSSKTSLKLKVVIQVKREYSFRLFKEDPSVLDVYVALESLARKDEIILCNYGRAKVVEMFDDHILVEVPHLGQRTIYDLTSIERYHD